MAGLTEVLTVPTVKAAIDALQRGDRKTWSELFEPGATLLDDGEPRDLAAFTREAVGHERFTAIERVEEHGLRVTGAFHSQRWGDFRTYFQFHLSRNGKIAQLDIGQAD